MILQPFPLLSTIERAAKSLRVKYLAKKDITGLKFCEYVLDLINEIRSVNQK